MQGNRELKASQAPIEGNRPFRFNRQQLIGRDWNCIGIKVIKLRNPLT